IGTPVLTNFGRHHVTRERIEPREPGPLVCGVDGGLHATLCIAQTINGIVYIFAAWSIEGGIAQLIEPHVRPWISRMAPWAIRYANEGAIVYAIDPTLWTGGQHDASISGAGELRRNLGGKIRPAPSPDTPKRRLAPLVAGLEASVGGR